MRVASIDAVTCALFWQLRAVTTMNGSLYLVDHGSVNSGFQLTLGTPGQAEA